jgi:hypothetical protein
MKRAAPGAVIAERLSRPPEASLSRWFAEGAVIIETGAPAWIRRPRARDRRVQS